MKTSNKSSNITGIVLLLLSAFFSISLILQVLDFGIGGPGHDNFFYVLGNMLYTVYGFSSLLIPVFLLVAAISCFASKWTSQKTMRLITALLPFFTSVVTEKICRMVARQNSGSSKVKIIITLIIGLMLIIIEILGAGIIAEKVNRKIFKKNRKSAADEYDFSSGDDELPEEESQAFVAEPIKPKKASVFDKVLASIKPNDEKETEKAVEAEDEVPVLDEIPQETEPAEKAVEDPAETSSEPVSEPASEPSVEVEEELEDESFDELLRESAELYGSDYESVEKKPEETPVENDISSDIPSIEDYENLDNVEPAAEPEKQEEEIQEELNPATIITQEEYAALIKPDTEELEWNNLPPASDELPPEYTEEIDEDDPSLKFPPEEDEEPEKTAEQEEVPVINLTQPQKPAVEPVYDDNNPYAAAKFVDDAVHPNPAYPYGISIHDDEPVNEVPQKNAQPRKVLNKYPVKISLGAMDEDEDTVPVAEYSSTPEPEIKDEDFDAYIEDETLPEPEFGDVEMEDSISPIFDDESVEDDDNTLDPEFFYIDMNAQEDNEDLSDDIEETPEELTNSSVFHNISAQEKKSKLTDAAADVFSEMENDILNENPDYDEDVEEETEIEDFNEKEDNFQVLNPNAGHATNLTADELTDFFNAQQKENTPSGKEIEGNLPTTNRATRKGPYVIPSDMLVAYKDDQYWIIDDETKKAAINLKQTLAEFNIEADVIGIKKGPVVTMFELLPAPGVRLSKIVALQDNIALSLAASSVRIVAPIPGKQAVGIEVPNKHRSVVGFREIIEMDLPEWQKMAVPVILGKDILGKAQLVDLVKTPHMLIAGATGSGKSVCVNSLILSILYKRSFKDVKMILVDPKVVELKLYNNIPHLLTPVITEPKKALQALQYCLCEMERRYALLDGLGVRDIASYNQRIKERDICTEKLPYIVVIIDEFADLMATSGRELESVIARLTAMSRAVGIHLVLATQRPSVNVITGLIKANIPSRIAFMVASRTDSNIIIDSVGAEKLLGRGDMLYASAVDPAPVRIQGTFVSDEEVENVVDYVKQFGEPDYIDDEIFINDDEEGETDLFGDPVDDDDPLYDQALEIVVQAGKASASYIQRRLKIGYNRAARLVEEMEERGIVGPANGSKPREVIRIP